MSGILIVEDDSDIRIDLSEILRDEGYEVAAASNGREALDWLRAGNVPCLILLDLMMPVMDGWQFRARQLKSPGMAMIPVVLLSGAGDLRKHATSLAAKGFISKPLELERVLGTVQQHCAASLVAPRRKSRSH
jgi:CheY-like chemotaxis protein